jgi:hypothetical protein
MLPSWSVLLGLDKVATDACQNKDIPNLDRMITFPRAGRRLFFFF